MEKEKERTSCEGITCFECFLLGDLVPDWPQRKVCRQLEQNLKLVMENEGCPHFNNLIIKETERS